MKKRHFITFTALFCATTMLAQTQAIRAFSHRGGRMERDENTLEAFQESWDGGYTGFETDIRMTT
ncbi:MAG: glycerophosphodiester phosphodiesterase, partial [Bacteroidaceae bacterium]|nr:glycerophosphodiester phosphodiesterase [Bacteroidaceae bacterium]